MALSLGNIATDTNDSTAYSFTLDNNGGGLVFVILQYDENSAVINLPSVDGNNCILMKASTDDGGGVRTYVYAIDDVASGNVTVAHTFNGSNRQYRASAIAVIGSHAFPVGDTDRNDSLNANSRSGTVDSVSGSFILAVITSDRAEAVTPTGESIEIYDLDIDGGDRAFIAYAVGDGASMTLGGSWSSNGDCAIAVVEILESPGVALTSDLIAHYALEEAATDYLDSSPNGLDLDGSSGEARVSGKINYGQSFNGGDYIQNDAIPAPGDLDTFMTGDYTMASWVLVDNTSGAKTIASAGEDSGKGTFLRVSNNDAHMAGIGSNNAISASTWYYVVGISYKEHISLFVDGVFVEREKDPITAKTTANSERFVLGTRSVDSGNDMVGDIDEVSIWGRCLSLTEIQSLYAGGSGLPYDQWVLDVVLGIIGVF